ncbi:MAG: mandelate racemase/muconate lactonizing enzyme family protein [Candidatus Latescibacterota bacterium]
MHISEVRIRAVSIPRIYDTRVAEAGGHAQAKTQSLYYVLELISDTGPVGLGEISDIESSWNTPTTDTLCECLSSLKGMDPLNRHETWKAATLALPQNLHPELRSLLSAAIDTALLDLVGQHYNAPLHVLLGGAHRTRVEVSWVAFIRAVEEIEGEISSKVAEGFTAFKLKVGDEPHLDRERVRICRRIAGPEAYIKVDASGQWEEEEAVEQISALAAVGANAVETPLRAAARALAKDAPETVNERAESVAEALARVRRRVPIELIEHVSDFDERFALALIARCAVDVFNVVPVQAGRLQRAQRLLNLAESGGLRALIGSTVELGIGTAAATHLAAACACVSVASDLVGPGLLKGDVVAPTLSYDRGYIQPPRGPGLGVQLDEERMQAYAV